MGTPTKLFSAGFGIVAVMLVTAYINFNTIDSSYVVASTGSTFDSGRSPASVGAGSAVVRSGDVVSENELAQKVSQKKASRSVASTGLEARELDKLRYEVLEGKYSVVKNGDLVQEIAFIDNPDTTGSPVSVGNRIAFLKRYAPLLGLSDEITRQPAEISGNNTVEKYQIKDKDDHDVLVTVTVDNSDRLIDLKAHSLQ